MSHTGSKWEEEFDEKFGTLRFRGVANTAIKGFIRKVEKQTEEKYKDEINNLKGTICDLQDEIERLN
jgi:hypothetical protein